MENVPRVLADDIVIDMVEEWRRRKAVPVSTALKVHGMLLEELAQELARRSNEDIDE